jgi:hypothetical protein
LPDHAPKGAKRGINPIPGIDRGIRLFEKIGWEEDGIERLQLVEAKGGQLIGFWQSAWPWDRGKL